MHFIWDENKAQANIKKHGISFTEASQCFYDPNQLAFYDPDHSVNEHRELLIGHSQTNRLLMVSYTIRNRSIRIISARKATNTERYSYAQGI